MSYLYNESNPLTGTGGQFCGKNKGILVSATATGFVDLYTYLPNGTTAGTRTITAVGSTLYPIRVWGVSCGAISGFTASVVS
jgi:carbon starvation protein CstA